jgi:hypothetical protein
MPAAGVPGAVSCGTPGRRAPAVARTPLHKPIRNGTRKLSAPLDKHLLTLVWAGIPVSRHGHRGEGSRRRGSDPPASSARERSTAVSACNEEGREEERGTGVHGREASSATDYVALQDGPVKGAPSGRVAEAMAQAPPMTFPPFQAVSGSYRIRHLHAAASSQEARTWRRPASPAPSPQPTNPHASPAHASRSQTPRGASARACPRHAVAALDGISGARVDWVDSKGLTEHERMAVELAGERSRLSAS